MRSTLNDLVGDTPPTAPEDPQPADPEPSTPADPEPSTPADPEPPSPTGSDSPSSAGADDHNVEGPTPDVAGEPISRATAGAFLGMVVAQVDQDLPGSTDASGRGRRPDSRTFPIRRLIAAVLALLGLGAMIAAWWWMGLSDDPAADQPPAAEQVVGDTAPDPGTDTAGCLVSADQIVVTNTITSDLAGKRDPALFSIVWDTTIENNSPTQVLLMSRLASSMEGEAGWMVGTTPIGSGTSTVLSSNYLNNNAGGVSGGLNWRLVGQVAVVVDAPQCRELLADPEAIPPGALIAVPIPDNPADIAVPAN